MTAQLQAVEAFRAFAEKTTGQPASVGLLSTGAFLRLGGGQTLFAGVYLPRPREPPGGAFPRRAVEIQETGAGLRLSLRDS